MEVPARQGTRCTYFGLDIKKRTQDKMTPGAELICKIAKAEEKGEISSAKKKYLLNLIHEEGITEEVIGIVEYETCSGTSKPVGKREKVINYGKSLNVLVALVILVPIFYFWIFGGDNAIPKKTPPPKQTVTKERVSRKDEGSDVDAFIWSQSYVEERLKSPSTAKFPSFYTGCTVLRIDKNTWVLESYVDSQNSFGAMLRKKYYAKMRYKGHYKWELLALEFD